MCAVDDERGRRGRAGAVRYVSHEPCGAATVEPYSFVRLPGRLDPSPVNTAANEACCGCREARERCAVGERGSYLYWETTETSRFLVVDFG